MRGFRALLLLCLCLLYPAALAAARGSDTSTTKWQTLSGAHPSVVAHDGFSGLFPASSAAAYNLALMTSVEDVILWCNVQLTKDAVGICFQSPLLGNGSNIANTQKKSETYTLNKVPVNGYFTVDFTIGDLADVFLTQGVLSRTERFDNSMFSIQAVEDVAKLNPSGLWLNFENNAFFQQHNLSMRAYVLSVMKNVVVSHISSTDGTFLSSISSRINPNVTKLILKFSQPQEVEPSTNQTYRSLLQNLASVKKFAIGILISKTHIWTVNKDGYLATYTSVVADAHKQGLEVFASDFANDVPYSYNFSYDPIDEYLHFIDNGISSVDGVLSDFPITPSAAIECFAHLGKNATVVQEKPLVITHNGASGNYAPSTDLAYTNAIDDGAEFIDCMVQVSKDGIPVCLASINLLDSANLAQSNFMNLMTTIPEIGITNGILCFNLTWGEIKSLKPQIYEPYAQISQLDRNPSEDGHGNFLKLSEFLDLAKNSSLSGVLIGIENAEYFVEKLRFDIIGAVNDALKAAGYSDQTSQKVIIQSTSSAVLQKFKGGQGNYELAYRVDDDIGDVVVPAIGDIAKVAQSVVITKKSVYPTDELFTIRSTDVVQKMQSHNLSVYVRTFRNEFLSQAWDFFSDATVEINTFFSGAGIDGVITEFPKTAARYKRNRCLSLKETPAYMSPVQAGSLLEVIPTQYLPPAQAPLPLLTVNNVTDPPLPGVQAPSPASSTNSSTQRAPTASPNAQPRNAVSLLLSALASLLAIVML